MKLTITLGPKRHHIIVATRRVQPDGREACFQCGNAPITHPVSFRVPLDTVGVLWKNDEVMQSAVALTALSGHTAWKCYLDRACLTAFLAAHLQDAAATQRLLKDVTRLVSRITTLQSRLTPLRECLVAQTANQLWDIYVPLYIHLCGETDKPDTVWKTVPLLHPWLQRVPNNVARTTLFQLFSLWNHVRHQRLTSQQASRIFLETMWLSVKKKIRHIIHRLSVIENTQVFN